MDMNIRDEMNKIYKSMVLKQQELTDELKKYDDFKFSCGFFNNHYHENESGEYVADYFPIPVISVNGLCDIEIDTDGLSVTSKLDRENALRFDYSHVADYTFEIYGTENFLTNYYVKGDNIKDTLHKIEKSSEETFFYSFYFDNSITGKEICAFIRFLNRNKFFY